MLQQATTTVEQKIPEERLKRAKYESNLEHASLKATKEVVNKTKGDEEHTFLTTSYLDEFTIIVWAQNMNNSYGTPIYSRSYLIALKGAEE